MDEDMSTNCVINQQQLFKEDGQLCMFSEGKGATTYPLHPCRHLFLLFGHHFSSFLGNFFRKAWTQFMTACPQSQMLSNQSFVQM